MSMLIWGVSSIWPADALSTLSNCWIAWHGPSGYWSVSSTTILITTHDMEEADTLCDELAILHQGRLAVVGKPDALKAQVGEQASLDDVFVHFSGVGLEQDGNYRGTRDSRDAIQRLG